MFPRLLKSTLIERLKKSPAAALLGARQVGKTTLAKEIGSMYYDVEQSPDRLRIDLEWEKIVTNRTLIVFDEAHVWPELFTRLRGAIDEDRRRHNRFLLLGSIAPGLMKQVSESLAGRLALCELAPLLAVEVAAKGWERLWFSGGYPKGGIADPSSYPSWQKDYLALLAERDLPEWGLPAKPKTTERFFHMLAALHGSLWNASQVGKGLGLSYHTVNSYLDYLESAFLIRRLPAYHRSIKKRILKSPKIYWRDSGLLHALLGIDVLEDLYHQPLVGLSWEGWIIEQILGYLQAKGATYQAFFLRTPDHQEIDLVLEYARHLWAFEIKLSTRPSEHDFRALNQVSDLIGADRRILVSRSMETWKGKAGIATNLADLLQILEGELP